MPVSMPTPLPHTASPSVALPHTGSPAVATPTSLVHTDSAKPHSGALIPAPCFVKSANSDCSCVMRSRCACSCAVLACILSWECRNSDSTCCIRACNVLVLSNGRGQAYCRAGNFVCFGRRKRIMCGSGPCQPQCSQFGPNWHCLGKSTLRSM